MQGYQLKAPRICLDKEEIIPENGVFDIKQKLHQPATFDDWVIFFSMGSKEFIKGVISSLKKSSECLGVTVEDPGYTLIKYTEEI